MQPKTVRLSKAVSAFTLIELLTVIAIIAILSAIIFPVFSNAQEKGRQATAISNMRQIQNGLERYRLDNGGRYPEVLFAYSDGASSMSAIKGAGAPYLKGLYPLYVKDASVFIDPNNDVKDTSSTAFKTLNVNQMDTLGALTGPVPAKFFQGDAYDIGPHIASTTDVDTNYVVRYQRAWTSTPMPTGFTPAEVFARQLDQPLSTGDTYVTMTTYHVHGHQKVLLLFKNGSTKVFDTSKLLSAGCGPDTTDITAAGGVANAKFWWITPSGTCP